MEMQNDLLNAEMIGNTAFKQFYTERVKNSQNAFYNPIKKASLKTFGYL